MMQRKTSFGVEADAPSAKVRYARNPSNKVRLRHNGTVFLCKFFSTFWFSFGGLQSFYCHEVAALSFSPRHSDYISFTKVYRALLHCHHENGLSRPPFFVRKDSVRHQFSTYLFNDSSTFRTRFACIIGRRLRLHNLSD